MSPGVDVARGLGHQTLGDAAAPVYADAEMEVYRVPDAPPRALPLFIDTGSVGWWKPKKAPDGVPFRWVDTRDDQGAELIVFNLSSERHRARVQFTAFNDRAARDVTVTIDGYPATRCSLAPSDTHDVTLELDMPPGLNVLTLTSPQPPIPVDARDGRDNRLLSFGVRRVRMEQIGG